MSERRDEAEAVSVASVKSIDVGQAICTVHKVLKYKYGVPDEVPVDASKTGLSVGSLAIVFGKNTADKKIIYEAAPMTETSLGYFAALPDTRRPASERLLYFTRFLEHPEPLIAQDAYAEFGRAPFDAVASVAINLPMEQFRGWLRSEQVPQERKGFYGLALGLARFPADRAANEALLTALIDEPANDFRAGFDGVLGGYLLLRGEAGLEHLEKRFIQHRDAPTGDVRHLLTAFRFYREYGREIPRSRLAKVLVPLLERDDVRTNVIADLARWQAWDTLPQVVALLERDRKAEPAASTAAIERAVAAYLLVCPEPAAREALDRLRARAPERVTEAEQTTLLFGGER